MSLPGSLGHRWPVSTTPPGRRLVLPAALGCPGAWTQGVPEPWVHGRPAKVKVHTHGSKPEGQGARRWEESLTGGCSMGAWELSLSWGVGEAQGGLRAPHG